MAKRVPITQQEVVALLRARAQNWIYLPNVTSIGVGYKIKGGKRSTRLSIQVTVREKLTDAQLRERKIKPLPKRVRFGDGRSVPVDVIARDYRLSYAITPEPAGSPFIDPAFPSPAFARRSRMKQVIPGVSISNHDGIAGTLGAIVFDNATGIACALSNAHVLLAPDGSVSDRVIQPGRSDDANVANNHLGRILRSHVGLAGDCAVAAIDARLFDRTILELNVAPSRLAKAEIDDAVVKSGRTTGVTRGRVVRIGVMKLIDYGAPLGTRSVGGFEIGPDPAAPARDDLIATGGDSGALWLIHENGAATDIAVGLHFASEFDPNAQSEHALACNLHSVLEQMDVSLRPKR